MKLGINDEAIYNFENCLQIYSSLGKEKTL